MIRRCFDMLCMTREHTATEQRHERRKTPTKPTPPYHLGDSEVEGKSHHNRHALTPNHVKLLWYVAHELLITSARVLMIFGRVAFRHQSHNTQPPPGQRRQHGSVTTRIFSSILRWPIKVDMISLGRLTSLTTSSRGGDPRSPTPSPDAR